MRERTARERDGGERERGRERDGGERERERERVGRKREPLRTPRLFMLRAAAAASKTDKERDSGHAAAGGTRAVAGGSEGVMELDEVEVEPIRLGKKMNELCRMGHIQPTNQPSEPLVCTKQAK